MCYSLQAQYKCVGIGRPRNELRGVCAIEGALQVLSLQDVPVLPAAQRRLQADNTALSISSRLSRSHYGSSDWGAVKEWPHVASPFTTRHHM